MLILRKADVVKLTEGNNIYLPLSGRNKCRSGVEEHGMQSRVYMTNMGDPNRSHKGIDFTSIKARKSKYLLGSQMDHTTKEAE